MAKHHPLGTVDRIIIKYLKNHGPTSVSTLRKVVYDTLKKGMYQDIEPVASIAKLKQHNIIENCSRGVYRLVDYNVAAEKSVDSKLLRSIETILTEHAKGPDNPADPKHADSRDPYHVLYNDLKFIYDAHKKM